LATAALENTGRMQHQNVRIKNLGKKQVGVVQPTHFNTGYILSDRLMKTSQLNRREQQFSE